MGRRCHRPGGPAVRPGRARPAVGHRHHRAPDARGQGLLLRRARRLQPPRRRLVDRSSPTPPWSRTRWAWPSTKRYPDAERSRDPLRPGHAVHVLGVHATGHRLRPAAVDGTVGDCYDNAIIESFWSRMQSRASQPEAMEDAGRTRQRDVRVPRDLPQPPAPPLSASGCLPRSSMRTSTTPKRHDRLKHPEVVKPGITPTLERMEQ